MRQQKDFDLSVDGDLVVGRGAGLVVLNRVGDVAALWVLVHTLLTAKHLSGHRTNSSPFNRGVAG